MQLWSPESPSSEQWLESAPKEKSCGSILLSSKSDSHALSLHRRPARGVKRALSPPPALGALLPDCHSFHFLSVIVFRLVSFLALCSRRFSATPNFFFRPQRAIDLCLLAVVQTFARFLHHNTARFSLATHHFADTSSTKLDRERRRYYPYLPTSLNSTAKLLSTGPNPRE